MDRQEIEAYAKSLDGKLPGGMQGEIEVREYKTEEGTVNEVNCTTAVPESTTFIPKLYCRDVHFKKMIVLQMDAGGFERDFSNYEFESEKVHRKFAIQAAPDQDENWLRQLFDPVFLDWLAEKSPEDFHFELNEGQLRGSFAHQPTSKEELDLLAELTAHVAQRLREESMEDAPVTEAKGPLAAPADTAEYHHNREMAAKVKWDQPPADMMAATKEYLHVAKREPGAFFPALLLGGGVGIFVLLVTLPFGFLFSGGGFDGIDKALDIVYIVVAVAIGGFLYIAARQSQMMRRAVAYGKQAFVDEYARSRDLEPEDPDAFMRNFIRLKMPGTVRYVMRGSIDGLGGGARLVIGSEHQREGGYAAAVSDAGKHADGPVDGADGAYVSDGHLVVPEDLKPEEGATVAGLDALAKRAGEVSKKL